MVYNPNNLHTTYADESDDKQNFVMAFVTVPTLSISASGASQPGQVMANDWDNVFVQVKDWRKKLKTVHNIPISKELKGSKLATGHNNYDGGRNRIFGTKAVQVYKDALNWLDFLPSQSIFSVYAVASYNMYGNRKLSASLYAALQRIEKQNQASHRRSMVFFDEGHGEYRTLFRKACVHLPTGSSQGRWSSGSRTQNKPLTTTIKDANFKDSKTSHFIQIADLIAYATLLKARAERGQLSSRQQALNLGNIHDEIPRRILNTRVVTSGSDGIVRLT